MLQSAKNGRARANWAAAARKRCGGGSGLPDWQATRWAAGQRRGAAFRPFEFRPYRASSLPWLAGGRAPRAGADGHQLSATGLATAVVLALPCPDITVAGLSQRARSSR